MGIGDSWVLTPGARQGHAMTMNLKTGVIYVFGGFGFHASGGPAFLNDLWQWDSGSWYWTWLNGFTGPNQNGVYGTMGVANSTNCPGARSFPAMALVPSSGILILFGGNGLGATGGSI
jgi:hypothetical protein